MSSTTTLTVMQDDGKRGELSQRSIRLQTIAPKDDQASSASSSRSRSAQQSTTTLPPRRGLPPRSRSGCWTCRQRKVKCDEGKPVCGQCSRLGHTCDYTHRLIFRDDTGRVLDRMSEGVSTVGCNVWQPAVADASSAPSSIGSPADDLPPFAMLTTDEERERKAEASAPGTFNVIMNPTSFQHLPEYAESFSFGRAGFSTLQRESMATPTDSLGSGSATDSITVAGDANLVILSRFEDPTRRPVRDLRLPVSPINFHPPFVKCEESPIVPETRSPEVTALQRFRDVVWKQLIPPDYDRDSSITLLDEAARQFPPLIRAMIALGSLSLDTHDHNDRLDSLQQYSETLPELQNSLKSEHDLASDGALLTHFLMLVYEITTADIEHQDIWSHHMQTLLKITLLRRNIYGMEKFPYVIWWICNIDLDALLSGTGHGTFLGYMLKNDLIPPPSYHLFPLGPDGTSVIYMEEQDTLPAALQLDYEVTVLAARLGLLTYEFRNDVSFDTLSPSQRAMTVKVRQSRILDLQESLRHLWSVPAIRNLSQEQLPIRAQRLLQRSWSMYRACIIYSHTSMWSGQRMDTSPDYDAEITIAAAQILHLALVAASSNEYNSRFLVFPLFMAGFASTDGYQMMQSLQCMQILEEGALGRNMSTTRKALKTIFESQNEQFMQNGHSLNVDWLQIMQERGLTVVNFGL